LFQLSELESEPESASTIRIPKECPIPYSYSCHVGCHYLHYSSLNASLCHLILYCCPYSSIQTSTS